MRDEIRKMVAMGVIPSESEVSEEQLNDYEQLLETITRPLTDEEAKAVVQLFGPDDCYGLAWSLLHLIETAPSWPIMESLTNDDNEWVQRLRRRVQNADQLDEG